MVLSVLLIILMVVYFSLDDTTSVVEIIQEDAGNTDLFAEETGTLVDEIDIENLDDEEEEEQVYNIYGLEEPVFFPGDTDKCKQQLNAAFEEAVQVATRELEVSMYYNEVCQEIIDRQEEYGVSITDNDDFFEWIMEDCPVLDIGTIEESLCPPLTPSVNEHFYTPEGVTTPIEIKYVDDMRRAIDSLVIWMNDANLYTLPTYDMREGTSYSACR